MDMSSPPTPRRRESVFLMADVTGDDSPAQRCRVRNLSKEGICLEQPVGLVRGHRIEVSVGMVERALAEVVWASDNFAGLRFVHPIDPSAARKRPRKSVDPNSMWARTS